jgi:hypothetical protein
MKLLCRILFVCLWVAPLVAQTSMTMPDGTVMTGAAVGAQYTSTDHYTLVDNQSNCVTYNCLILTNKTSSGAPVSFWQISSGFDGYTLALDGAGNVWTIPTSHTTAAFWSKVITMGSGLKGIAVRNATEIYALIPAGGCATNYYQLARWTDHWVYISGCLTEMSITADNYLVGLYAGGLYYTSNPDDVGNSPTWVRVGTQTNWSHVTASNGTEGFATIGTVLYRVNFSASTWAVVSGAPAISNTLSSLAATPDGYLFVRSNVAGTKGNFYVYSFGDSLSTTWTNLKGNVAFVGGGTRLALFAQDSAANLYHYLAVALSHTSNVVGSYDCGAGCPAGAMHTASAMGNFPHGIQTVTSHYVTVSPATQVNVSHVDVSTICDPVFGDPSSPDCFLSGPRTTAQVSCSVMGSLFQSVSSITLLDEKIAFTRVIYKGTGGHNCSTDKYGINWCAYDVDNWCSPSTDTPYTLADFTGRSVKDAHFYGYWNTYTACVRVLSLGWTCLDGGGIINASVAVGSNAQLPKANCSTK